MRDRLIELLKKADKNASDKGITDYDDAIADNADYLLANNVIVQQEWINALGELPKENERVLVKLEDMGYNGVNHTLIDTDRIMRGRWVRWSGYVTHWMPLTELQKGVQ